jgi:hypothetical protein
MGDGGDDRVFREHVGDEEQCKRRDESEGVVERGKGSGGGRVRAPGGTVREVG